MELFVDIMQRFESEAGVVARATAAAQDHRRRQGGPNLVADSSVLMFNYGLEILGSLLSRADDLSIGERRQAVELARKLQKDHPDVAKIKEVTDAIIAAHR